MTRKHSAFTLVEILIVVIILGILAAIVIPQFTEASNDARESAMKSDLQTVRSQLELYKVQHLDSYPDDFAKLTSKTNADGTTTNGTLGPYLTKMPTNGYNDKATVEIEAGTDGRGDNSHGWHFDSTGGTFAPDDNATHAAW